MIRSLAKFDRYLRFCNAFRKYIHTFLIISDSMLLYLLESNEKMMKIILLSIILISLIKLDLRENSFTKLSQINY